MSKKVNAAESEELVAQDDAAIGRALRWSLLMVVMLLVVIGGVAIWWRLSRPAGERVVVAPVTPQLRRTTTEDIPSFNWTDITHASGIDFTHVNGAYGDKLLPETMGGGVAFFDFDNDGDQDLLLVNSQRWPWDPRPAEATPTTCRLFANDGTGKFTDVSTTTGLDQQLYGMGAAIGDFDNDGWTDVFLSAVGKNRLLRNESGRFVDVTDAAGVAGDEQQWSTSCAFFDYDNDGLLDLVVCNYVQWSKDLDLNQSFTLIGGGRAYGPPRSFGGTFPYLYHNEGNGTFTEVGEAMGLHVTNHATGVPLAKGMGVSPVDVNQDGYLDLVIANDTVQNFLLINQAGKRFSEIGELSGIAFDRAGAARGAMGIDSAIFRADGTLAIGIGNFANEMSALYTAKAGKTLFFDAATATGFGPPSRLVLTFGIFFFDADLDGRLDILGANGHLEQEISKVLKTQTYAQPPQLFWNAGLAGPTELVRVPDDKLGADFVAPMVGRGAAYADIDGDGDLDVVIAANGAAPRLLRNQQSTGNHWLRLQLRGNSTNRSAIGALVTLHQGEQRQVRCVMATRSYCSQCELPVTFGLGQQAEVDAVTIRWPSGKEQRIERPQVDQRLVVDEPSAES